MTKVFGLVAAMGCLSLLILGECSQVSAGGRKNNVNVAIGGGGSAVVSTQQRFGLFRRTDVNVAIGGGGGHAYAPGVQFAQPVRTFSYAPAVALPAFSVADYAPPAVQLAAPVRAAPACYGGGCNLNQVRFAAPAYAVDSTPSIASEETTTTRTFRQFR